MRTAIVLFWLLTTSHALADASMARAIEGRLLAPCCWNQTLDVHESPLATTLRAEIHSRLDAGESGARIEDDLALRYGERIRAVPRGAEPRGTMALALTLALFVSLIGVGGLVRYWTQPGPRVTASRVVSDARLDEELSRFDES